MTAKRDECSCCYDAMMSAGLSARKLTKLVNSTFGYNKRKQQYAVFICSWCDLPHRDN